MKIVILDAYTANPGDLSWQALASLGDLAVHDRTPAEAVLDRAADAQIVLTNKVPFDAERLAGLPELKLISVLATGFNIIDIDAAKQQGVVVCNVPAYSTDSVAQRVFALLLSLTDHVALHNASVHAGEWQQCDDFMYTRTPLTELAGKTMGVFGYGTIGRRVAQIALAMGMRVLAHSRSRSDPIDDPRFGFTDMDTLFAESDVVSLHAPQTPQTQGVVDARRLASMKSNAILINTARGGLVVERDLADALNAGVIAAAAVDVVSAEPIEADNPLLGARHIVITPHNTWATREARQRLIDITVQNVSGFIAGQPVNVVS